MDILIPVGSAAALTAYLVVVARAVWRAGRRPSSAVGVRAVLRGARGAPRRPESADRAGAGARVRAAAQAMRDFHDALLVMGGAVADACTGYVDAVHGLQHDGHTCPIHEGGVHAVRPYPTQGEK